MNRASHSWTLPLDCDMDTFAVENGRSHFCEKKTGIDVAQHDRFEILRREVLIGTGTTENNMVSLIILLYYYINDNNDNTHKYNFFQNFSWRHYVLTRRRRRRYWTVIKFIHNCTMSDDACVSCGSQVGNSQDAVTCDICRRWTHLQCSCVHKELYAHAVKKKLPLPFTCYECQVSSSQFIP